MKGFEEKKVVFKEEWSFVSSSFTCKKEFEGFQGKKVFKDE